jgi:HAD superfamily hydrolase (TIGR01509 family)
MSSDESGHDKPAAVLFDVDGTLVDSNYLHVHAWQRAFMTEDVAVEAWRIHRCIGMDGSALVKTLSEDAAEDVSNRLKEGHSRYYRQTVSMLRPLPGARELLHRVADSGLQVVLATSAPEDELATLREVLECDDVVSEVTSSGDVDTAKPKPDIVQVALGRAGVTADRAVFIGDAVWDAEAARRAGVTCIGVLSGGVSRSELVSAGAVEVFENAAQLLDHLDETPIAALKSNR